MRLSRSKTRPISISVRPWDDPISGHGQSESRPLRQSFVFTVGTRPTATLWKGSLCMARVRPAVLSAGGCLFVLGIVEYAFERLAEHCRDAKSGFQ